MSLDHAVLNAPPRQSGTPDARLAWWTALAGVAVGLLSGVGLLAGQFVLAYAGYASAALVATAILSLPVLAVVVALLPKPGVIPKIRTTSGADTSDLVDAAPRAAGAMA
ncbi:hypothetical protein, partial [Microbacterium sp.]|uniref:hypothetical protein n=1 Tax=Microbacterium sp. TaxID=51671 RepID=UPI002811521E